MTTEQKPSRAKARTFSKEFKEEIVQKLEAGTTRPVEVLNEHALSPSTLYGWIKRYKKEGVAGLATKSTRPHHQPKKTYQWIIDKIIGIKSFATDQGE
jgi:transposase-like protein